MPTFTFSLPITKPVAQAMEMFARFKKTNGLFRTLQLGYSNHFPIAIRPDDVLNTVGCIWAKYIILNAERFRDFFVVHGGKKVLTYKSGGMYSRSRMPEFLAGLLHLVKTDQANDKLDWLDVAMTTTLPVDRLVRSSVALASQKEYYAYRVQLCCGFSAVTLLGTAEDWAAVVSAIRRMPALDDDLGRWREQLVGTIDGMLSGDESFWQKCITNEAGGSGPRDYDGWILAFNPFDEHGMWLSRMENYDILNLTVDFDILVDDNGHEFKVRVEAGPTELSVMDDGTVATATVFSVEEIG